MQAALKAIAGRIYLDFPVRTLTKYALHRRTPGWLGSD